MERKRSRISRRPLAVLLPALALGGPLPAQEAGPTPSRAVTATAEVTLVEVPVHVTGPDGFPVRGLTKEDFELLDDGRKAEIESMDVVDLEAFARPLAVPGEMPLPPAARRHFFLLFDLTFSSPIRLSRARAAARDFVLDGMKSGDLGAVATFDVERGLKLVLSFTSDRDQLAAAVETLGLPGLLTAATDPLALTVYPPSFLQGTRGTTIDQRGGRIGDSEIADALSTQSKLQDKVFDTYQQGRIRQMARSFGDLARTLASVRGRKHVLLFSEGFDSKLLSGVTGPESGRAEGDLIVSGELWKVEPEDRYGRNEVKLHLEEMFQLFRRADASIQAVDVAGLSAAGAGVEATFSGDTGPSERLGSRGRGQDTLFLMAESTGGELYRNSNEVEEHLERLQQQTALVYLLTFAPKELKEPGRYHSLKVKVRRPGLKASARSGYYEPRPWSKLTGLERRLAAAQQIAYGLPRTEIPMSAIAAPVRRLDGDGALVPVILEVPGRGLLRDGPPGSATVEVYAYAVDQQLKVKDFVSQTLTLDLGKVGPALRESGLKLYADLFLPPGSYWLRLLVRNAETGRTGLAIVPAAVPLPERRDLYVLPPLFHEPPGRWVMVKAPPRPGGPPAGEYPFATRGSSFVPAADPVLAAGEEAPLSLMVWNAPADAELAVAAEIRDVRGQRAGTASLEVTSREPARGRDPVKLLCTLRPRDVAAGSYSLLVTVRDPRSGAEAQSAGTFEIR
ncbi:MAG: VWA domain-containing protein [Acidobacteria bacterium]|nr:MAG: VWA domain-containing protein [Acidobacteriota bacterium]MCE7957238.1 VWA domain-containing protein [Acidobacteria bacterium ACB2]